MYNVYSRDLKDVKRAPTNYFRKNGILLEKKLKGVLRQPKKVFIRKTRRQPKLTNTSKIKKKPWNHRCSSLLHLIDSEITFVLAILFLVEKIPFYFGFRAEFFEVSA